MPRTRTLGVLWIVAAIAILLPLYPGCPFHAVTGLLCPGCGGRRALAALVSGRWYDAVHLNPLVALGIPVFALRVCWILLVRPQEVIPVGLVPALLAIAVLFAAARNILPPF